MAATYGETTVAEIYRHAADWAFLSPVGLHVEQGATSYEHREVAVARAMVRQSTRTAILADHSKLGQISRVSFCPISEIDMLVVNSRARKESAFAELEATGLDVILA